MLQEVIVEDLGRQRYQPVWDLQERILQSGIAIKKQNAAQAVAETSTFSGTGLRYSESPQDTRNYLLFVEHYPVYTLGKSGNLSNLLIPEAELVRKQIEFVHTNRGGDITYHGPGQVVGYPILDLEKFGTDIGKYLRNIEEVIIRVLERIGITAGRSSGETGVWIDADIAGRERKIAAIGVRCSRWITMHGFALNVNTDLRYFDNIIPCGITGKAVTSIEKETGRILDPAEIKSMLLEEFQEVFNCSVVESRNDLQNSFGI